MSTLPFRPSWDTTSLSRRSARAQISAALSGSWGRSSFALRHILFSSAMSTFLTAPDRLT